VSRPDTTPATPQIRALAARHGVILASVEPTGAGGRIRRQDVLDAAGITSAPVDELAAIRASATYRGVPGWSDPGA
jgi:pyruvate/2-oxoglutarate dehydrogenase complex dihydrolipoamide acyltransferase (E2) component